jgi:alanine-glyoxylate transaminase/serine-glyoxylate transaminase/serine-pyruvate transaminase
MWTRGQRLLLSSVNSRLLPRMAPTSRAAASSRINQIAKHLDSKPFLEINTPFSTERSSRFEDGQGNVRRPRPQEKKKPEEQVQKADIEAPKKADIEPPKKMSNQKQHPALLIPGPIEFDDAVLDSMSHHRCVWSRNCHRVVLTRL